MIVVTGGAGFIGSNLIKGLNQRNHTDILVVDNLTNGIKFNNLVSCKIADYIDKEDFLTRINTAEEFSGKIDAIFHLGACSTTTEWDGRYMMRNNYEYTKALLHYCLQRGIPLIYASSAAVYGGGHIFKEEPEFESPLNVYGYSKFQFDQYLRRLLPQVNSQVVGLRYFNVYGPGESHKGSMASVALHFHQQIVNSGELKLFAGCDGYGDGEQQRDFIYVDDVVAVNLWFLENPKKSGIFNVGTGRSQTFNDVAQSVIRAHGQGKITYIPFPEKLRGCYQSFTQADISKLRNAGFEQPFKTVEQGVHHYMETLLK